MTNAYNDLINMLDQDEQVEAIVFGAWGWASAPRSSDEEWEPDSSEPEPPPVPFKLRGKTMTLEEARPYMQGWSFIGGFGAPDCYATYIWTNQRIIWVTQYDGATGLDSAPRYPHDCIPDMPGG